MITLNKINGKDVILCRTKGVCAHTIRVILDEDNKIEDVIFVGGCHGNAIAVGRLIKGMTIPEVIKHLDGVICGNKGTSCTDQLAKCLQEYLDKK
jgi:uncharacterized protein (TIGR03905 family)